MDTAFAAEVFVLGSLYWGKVAYKQWRFARKHRHNVGRQALPPAEKAFLAIWLVLIAVWLLQPIWVLSGASGPAWLLPLKALDRVPLKIAGSLLAVPSYLLSLWVWTSMGRSWRLSVDDSGHPPLVTVGPYAFCRHPLYALQLVLLLGCVLALPTPMMLGALIAHAIAIWLKTRAEEHHLRRAHGEAYQDYCRRVGRFFTLCPSRRGTEA